MRIAFLAVFVLVASTLTSCLVDSEAKHPQLTPEQEIQRNLDTLKMIAQDGDMVTRMNDNIISFHVKNLNHTDKTFSHAGIIVTRDGQKMVCNIDANDKGKDTVRYEPIDSFLNPKDNYICGLFRFKLTDTEREDFIAELNRYHDDDARFD